MANDKELARLKRKIGIRKKITGTTERPRLTVFRSARHAYAQVIDDSQRKVIASVTTVGKAAADMRVGTKKCDQAKKIGEKIAQLCKEKGITQVVFDRNGFRYHGRIMAIANGAREAGLQF